MSPSRVNGVSLFPDMARGLAELVRVTRSGGRVVIVAFGQVETVEFIVFCASAVRAAVPGAPPLPTTLPFQAANPDVLRERLAIAGLRDVRIDTFTWETASDSDSASVARVHQQQPPRRADGRRPRRPAAGGGHTRPRGDAA